jgi:hypothetical protein
LDCSDSSEESTTDTISGDDSIGASTEIILPEGVEPSEDDSSAPAVGVLESEDR